MTTQVEAPTTFRWDRLTYSSALGYCLLVAGLSVGVVLSELRDEFGISGVVAALHGSTFGIGLLFAGVFGVKLVDRVGRRQVLTISAACLAGGVVLFCIGPSWPITLLGTAFSGAGGALLVMVMPGLISDHHGEHRAAAFAAVNGAPGIAGVAFSLVIGGALSAGWSWRPPYLILTGVFTLALVVVAHPVALPDGERHGAFSLRHFFDRDVLVPWAHIVNAVLAEFTVGIWAVTYLREVGHAGAGLAPILASVFGVMMFATRLALPVLLRWWGEATISYSFVVIGAGADVGGDPRACRRAGDRRLRRCAAVPAHRQPLLPAVRPRARCGRAGCVLRARLGRRGHPRSAGTRCPGRLCRSPLGHPDRAGARRRRRVYTAFTHGVLTSSIVLIRSADQAVQKRVCR